jgi:peptide chain release factor 1
MQIELLLNKIISAEERYSELQAWMSSPGALADMAVYRAKVTECKNLEPIVLAYSEYKRLQAELSDAEELISCESDVGLIEMAHEEMKVIRDAMKNLESQLALLLIPKDPLDDRNIIVEIRAGAGGEEAALFVADLYRMYTMFAQKNGYGIEIMYANETELGGFREVDFMLLGKGIYSRLKYESGVHRVQRVPKTESQGKIQTSTVTVAILPEVEAVDVEIKPQDIRMESCKSSGAGGQHINKTESAVRLTHIPTGIVVECQEERSQFKNREKAMKLLEARLYQIQQAERDSKIASDRKSQVGTGERCERIRTYNFPQGRVTDHRVNVTIYSIDRFLAGDMDEILMALAAQAAEAALEER